MIKNVINEAVTAGSGRKEFTETFGSFSLDNQIIRLVVSGVDAGSSLRKELEKIHLYASVKNPEAQDIILIDNVNLKQFAILSDFNGGSSLDNIESEGKTTNILAISIPAGKVILEGQDEIVYKMIFEDPKANIDVKLNVFDMALAPESIFCYKGFESNGQSIREPDVMQVFNMSAADGKMVTFTDQEGTDMIDDYTAQALANTMGEIESFEDEIGFLYNDRHMIGQDLEIKVPSGCSLLFIEMVYAPERYHALESVEIKREKLLEQIKLRDPDKYYAIVG